MSNYPEGVTGFEYEIAGPDFERDETHEVSCPHDECSAFEQEREVLVTERWYRGEGFFYWTCPACHREHHQELFADV